MSPIVIADIDGTCSDPTHRRKYVDGSQPKDWEKFYDLAGDDGVHEDIRKLLVQLRDAGYWIVYVTGRPERLRGVTETWLREKGFPTMRYHLSAAWLLMRPDGDTRQDYIVKEEILDQKLGGNKHNIWFALDDRDQVVKMWRRRGIRCLQVTEGDF